MNEVDFAETQPTQVDEIPDELPVLPLKETVVFPDSMAPLAIGQERSIRLVDDVVAGERLLALVTVRDAELPIGGVRDKVLAAQRAGLGRVILPRENAHDLEELPPETRDALRFVLVDSIGEVFDAAFNSNGAAESGRVRAAAAQG
jgi:ATP-dependent Lon protease